jgi:hypothetical protein
MGKRHNILINQKFGSLIVKEHVKDPRGGIWKCLCDCGKYKNCEAYRLLSGYTKSCGCLNTKDYNYIIGRKYCLLTPIEVSEASGDGSSSNASLVSPSLNEEFNKKSRVYILKR